MTTRSGAAARSRAAARRLGRVQGAYFLVSGLWPIVSLRSFERVTGPKADDWLVRTVGLLAAVIGAVLVRQDGRAPRVARDLGLGSAAAFAGVDAWYALRGRIAPIYLADAAVQAAFGLGWLRLGRRGTGSSSGAAE